MDSRIDLPRDLLHKNEGNIWINKQTKQLRYNASQNGTASWINPISEYEVGQPGDGLIKRGQPVSIGLASQLDATKAGNGPSAVVATDPEKNKWATGIAIQPGTTNETDGYYGKIHVQSSGQVVYDLANKDDSRYYLPSYTYNSSYSKYVFDWTYDDIGKEVYVSNKDKGTLTLSLADASFDGGTIICIGHIADAPLSPSDEQKIVIEVQISGDTRGVLDSTQITVSMAQAAEAGGTATDSLDSDKDKLLFVKIENDKGYFILDESDLNSSCQPVGAVLIKSENGKINYGSLYGKDIVATRLGVVSGDFGVAEKDIGKVLYLNGSNIGYYSESDSVEFKIGVALDTDRILVDCRYIKDYTKFSMIGTIKPAYSTISSTGEVHFLTDPGFVAIDPDVVYALYKDTHHKATNTDGVDLIELVRACYAKDIFLFSKDGTTFSRLNETTVDGKKWTINGDEDTNKILDAVNGTYVKFRDIYYTIRDDSTNYKQACQIKYSKEGSDEDSQAYVWPEQAYTIEIETASKAGSTKGADGGTYETPKIRVNITSLVSAGRALDNNSLDIESYDITLKRMRDGTVLAPGFRYVDGKWYGYEWRIANAADGRVFLYMVTTPEGANEASSYGPCSGSKAMDANESFVIVVRRRPTQYNSFYLNQFPSLNPWTPMRDSAGNLVAPGDKLYFGANLIQNAETTKDASTGFADTTAYTSYMQAIKRGNAAEVITKVNGQAEDSKESLTAGETTGTVIRQIISLDTASGSKDIVWTYDFSDSSTPIISVNGVLPGSTFVSVSPEEKKKNSIASSALDALSASEPYTINYDTADEKDETSDIIYYGKLKDSYKTDIIFNAKLADSDTVEQGSSEKKALGDQKLFTKIYNGNSVNFLSNIGLLNKAAAETNEQLYKLNRAVFGDDFESTDTSRVSRLVGRDGLSRVYSFLSKFGFYESNPYEFSNIGSTRDFAYNKVYSLLYEYIVDNYGKFTSPEDYDAEVKAFSERATSSDKPFESYIYDRESSHLRTLWWFYHGLSAVTEIPMVMLKSIAPNTNIAYVCSAEDDRKPGYYISSNSIMAGVVAQTSNFAETTANASVNGSLLAWPVEDNYNFPKEFNLESFFFSSKIVGLSDASALTQGTTYKYLSTTAENGATFSPQSVTGWLLDAFTRLSFLKSLFDIDHSFKSAGILTKPWTAVAYDSYFESLTFRKNDTCKFNEYTSLQNTYTAFQFSNNKIIKAFSSELQQNNESRVFTQYSQTDSSNFTMSQEPISRYSSKGSLNSFNNNGKIYSITTVEEILELHLLRVVSSKEAECYTNMLQYPEYDTNDDGSSELSMDAESLKLNADKYNAYVDEINGNDWGGDANGKDDIDASENPCTLFKRVIPLNKIEYSFSNDKFTIKSTPSLCHIDGNGYIADIRDGLDAAYEKDNNSATSIQDILNNMQSAGRKWSYILSMPIDIHSNSATKVVNSLSLVKGNSEAVSQLNLMFSQRAYDNYWASNIGSYAHDSENGEDSLEHDNDFGLPPLIYDDAADGFASRMSTSLDKAVLKVLFRDVAYPLENSDWTQQTFADGAFGWNNYVRKTVSSKEFESGKDSTERDVLSNFQSLSKDIKTVDKSTFKIGETYNKRLIGMPDILISFTQLGVPTKSYYTCKTTDSQKVSDSMLFTVDKFKLYKTVQKETETSNDNAPYDSVNLKADERIGLSLKLTFSNTNLGKELVSMISRDASKAVSLRVNNSVIVSSDEYTFSSLDNTISVVYGLSGDSLTDKAIFGAGGVDALYVSFMLSGLSSQTKVLMLTKYKDVDVSLTIEKVLIENNTSKEITAYNAELGKNETKTLPFFTFIMPDTYKLTEFKQKMTELSDEDGELTDAGKKLFDESKFSAGWGGYSEDSSFVQDIPESLSLPYTGDGLYGAEIRGYDKDDTFQDDDSKIGKISVDAAFDEDAMQHVATNAKYYTVEDSGLLKTLKDFISNERADLYSRDIDNCSSGRSIASAVVDSNTTIKSIAETSNKLIGAYNVLRTLYAKKTSSGSAATTVTLASSGSVSTSISKTADGSVSTTSTADVATLRATIDALVSQVNTLTEALDAVIANAQYTGIQTGSQVASTFDGITVTSSSTLTAPTYAAESTVTADPTYTASTAVTDPEFELWLDDESLSSWQDSCEKLDDLAEVKTYEIVDDNYDDTDDGSSKKIRIHNLSKYDTSTPISSFDGKLRKLHSIVYDKAYMKRHLQKDYFLSGTKNEFKKNVYLSEYDAAAKQNSLKMMRAETNDGKPAFSDESTTYKTKMENWKFSSNAFIYAKQLPQPDAFLKLRWNDINYLAKIGFVDHPAEYNSSSSLKTVESLPGDDVFGLTFALSNEEIYFKYDGLTYKVTSIGGLYLDGGENFSINFKRTFNAGIDGLQIVVDMLANGYYQNFLFSPKFELVDNDNIAAEAAKAKCFLISPNDENVVASTSSAGSKSINIINTKNNYNVSFDLNEENLRWMIKNSNIFAYNKDILQDFDASNPDVPGTADEKILSTWTSAKFREHTVSPADIADSIEITITKEEAS